MPCRGVSSAPARRRIVRRRSSRRDRAAPAGGDEPVLRSGRRSSGRQHPDAASRPHRVRRAGCRPADREAASSPGPTMLSAKSGSRPWHRDRRAVRGRDPTEKGIVDTGVKKSSVYERHSSSRANTAACRTSPCRRGRGVVHLGSCRRTCARSSVELAGSPGRATAPSNEPCSSGRLRSRAVVGAGGAAMLPIIQRPATIDASRSRAYPRRHATLGPQDRFLATSWCAGSKPNGIELLATGTRGQRDRRRVSCRARDRTPARDDVERILEQNAQRIKSEGVDAY